MIDELINLVLDGYSPSNIINSLSNETDQLVNTFFDSNGDLRFSTLDNVLIIPDNNKIMKELIQIADSAGSDTEIHEILDNYSGSLNDLYKAITKDYSLV